MNKIPRIAQKFAIALVAALRQFPRDFARAWRELGRP